MKIYIYFLLLSIFIIGCTSQQRAMRSLTKITARHPHLLSGWCGRLYPPLVFAKDSMAFKPGISPGIIYVHADCDSVVHAKGTGHAKVLLPCPQQRVADTVILYKERQLVNRAGEDLLAQQVVDFTTENAVLRSQKALYLKFLLVLAIYTLLRWIFRIWNIKLP